MLNFFNTPLTVQYNFCAISGTKSPKKYFSNRFECFQSHGNETYLFSRPFFYSAVKWEPDWSTNQSNLFFFNPVIISRWKSQRNLCGTLQFPKHCLSLLKEVLNMPHILKQLTNYIQTSMHFKLVKDAVF